MTDETKTINIKDCLGQRVLEINLNTAPYVSYREFLVVEFSPQGEYVKLRDMLTQEEMWRYCDDVRVTDVLAPGAGVSLDELKTQLAQAQQTLSRQLLEAGQFSQMVSTVIHSAKRAEALEARVLALTAALYKIQVLANTEPENPLLRKIEKDASAALALTH